MSRLRRRRNRLVRSLGVYCRLQDYRESGTLSQFATAPAECLDAELADGPNQSSPAHNRTDEVSRGCAKAKARPAH